MAEEIHYHLIGICGTAMASLAGLLKGLGYRITGSDENVYPPMSTLLEGMNIPVFKGYSARNISKRPDIVVVGNAIPRGNDELEEVLNQRIPYTSMPEVMKERFLRSRRPIVIAGTHGKTTVTALTAWLLEHGGHDPGFLIGGIAQNYKVSFKTGTSPFFVIEGDEYDTAYFDKRAKFHHYLPECLVINALEYDHADIYPDL
ncbi:Mur ligase domain-containing protein, partial [Acidobacteriota bacterium]